MQKVQFNYEVWKNHPEREKILLVTRNDSPVTCFTDAYVGKINDSEQLYGVHDYGLAGWDLNGNFLRPDDESDLDLFMILPDNNEMFVPIFRVPDLVNGGKRLMNLGITTTKEESDELGASLGVLNWEFLGTYKLVKQ